MYEFLFREFPLHVDLSEPNQPWFIGAELLTLATGSTHDRYKIYPRLPPNQIQTRRITGLGPGAGRKFLTLTASEILLRSNGFRHISEFLEWAQTLTPPEESVTATVPSPWDELRRIRDQINELLKRGP